MNGKETNNPVLEIIHLCRKLDHCAHAAYLRFSEIEIFSDSSGFWLQKADEEKMHMGFWDALIRIGEEFRFPDIFPDIQEVARDLEKIKSNCRVLLDSCGTAPSIQTAFLIAFRLEFYLMHPAFEILFNFLRVSVRTKGPENYYEAHIQGFFTGCAKYAAMTPELELVQDALRRLWTETHRTVNEISRDYLTGTYNRKGFMLIAVQLSYLAARQGKTVGVLMADVDHFKQFNDRHGHKAGDLVLKTTAGAIQKSLRNADVLGRFGGEEFAVFLPDMDSSMLSEISERVRKSVENADLNGMEVTISIGGATGTIKENPEKDLEFLLQEADRKMYLAKESGRNRSII